ncbi:MAG TPA: M3 family metallopeptidase [Steroidobacteraceae bacterium]|jgi:peptidyl-dipeptidase Dcp|nr:M3 family metallopeptidase [Steroidobacteraceae bacterium]
MRMTYLAVFAAAVMTAALAAAATPATGTSAMADNPFAQPSKLPFELPPFDRIRDGDYLPAYREGMRIQLEEVAAIANNPAAPTFDNTIVALERSGQLLTRTDTAFQLLNACNTDDKMQAIDTEMAPKLAAHQDAILLNPVLWKRVDALYRERAQLKLAPESQQLLVRYHTLFVRAGAQLDPAQQARLKELNQQISSLTTRFKQNVLKATTDGAVVVDNVSDLDGLSQEQIGAAAQAASGRGLKGKWLITLQNTTNQAVLTNLKNRALRERIYKASISRGLSGPTDNTPVVAQVMKLRAERAQLLGFPSHAAYQLADESAGTPQAVRNMISQVAPAALARTREEAADLQKLIDAQAKAAGQPTFQLQPWDWFYYSEQVRKARYDFDEAQVAPYFEADRVLKDGVFYAAHQLYGLTFKERKDLPVYQPDVRVFEVFDSNGKPLALYLTDLFARDNKQGGAWMNSYVNQSHLLKQQAVVAIHLNIPKPQPGQPVLLTFDEVTTMFHETGHALHGMLSNVNYPLLSGTNVPPDFVEYPSQYNEMWAREPAVVAHYARHYQTGAPMPQQLLDRVIAAQRFDQGYATTEYIEAALLDLAWHQVTVAQVPAAGQVQAFEQAALKASGLDYPPVPPRYHTTYFSHIFDGGYSAGYYAYLWSEVLARDTGQWMHAHGGLTATNGAYLREHVLSRGRSEDPQVLFRNFYGRDPDIGPLLEYRGLKAASGG